MEESYPVLEKPMTDHQWKSVTLGIGDGILDEGGNPYRITLSDETNQATVHTDTLSGYNHAILRGFYHRMDKAIELNLPPVRTETTYTIALQYDPTRSDAPVKLGVFTEIDRSGDKAYIILHAVTRKPSQLLTDATVVAVGQAIRPTIQVDKRENLPDSTTVLWGTQAHCWRENVTYRASWGEWQAASPFIVPLQRITGWSFTTEGGGVVVTPAQGGFHCHLVGVLSNQRDSFWTDGWSPVGQPLPEKWRPSSHLVRFAVNTTDNGDYAIRTRLSPSGLHLAGFQKSDRNHIQKNFPTYLEFDWFTPMDPRKAS